MTSTARNNRPSSQFMKDEYADVKQDLYGAFVVRGIELANGAGLLAIVIGDTWMSIKSFESLRQRLLTGHAFSSFVHMHDVSNHPDIFGANAAFVLAMSGDKQRLAPFIRLASLGQERKEAALKRALQLQTAKVGFHRSAGMHFEAIPGSPIVYWLSEKMRSCFSEHPPLQEVAQPRQGLATTENARFLRSWWEVSRDRCCFTARSTTDTFGFAHRWYPHNKGGNFRKWWGNQEHLVNWENDGADIKAQIVAKYPYLNGKAGFVAKNTDKYFKSSVSWTLVSSSTTAFRAYPEGFIFDVAGNSLFPSSPGQRNQLLGQLNSNLHRRLLEAVAPTLNFVVGDVAKIPVYAHEEVESFEHVSALIATSKTDWDCMETSWGFSMNPLVQLQNFSR